MRYYYLEIVERNKWERETWNFFVPMLDSIDPDVYASLYKLLKETGGRFELLKRYDQEDEECVHDLVECADRRYGCYMPSHNFAELCMINPISTKQIRNFVRRYKRRADQICSLWNKGSIHFS